jgi:hypothetical protein
MMISFDGLIYFNECFWLIVLPEDSTAENSNPAGTSLLESKVGMSHFDLG